jgi:hypothetical protein
VPLTFGVLVPVTRALTTALITTPKMLGPADVAMRAAVVRIQGFVKPLRGSLSVLVVANIVISASPWLMKYFGAYGVPVNIILSLPIGIRRANMFVNVDNAPKITVKKLSKLSSLRGIWRSSKVLSR